MDNNLKNSKKKNPTNGSAKKEEKESNKDME